MDFLLIPLQKVLSVIPIFGAVLLFLLVSKWLYQKLTRYRFDEQLTAKDNPACGVFLALLFSGLAMGLASLTFGSEGDILNDLISLAVFGPVTALLMWLGVLINDKLILSKFSIEKEIIQDRNVGAAFVVGGGCLATGLVISGANAGISDSVWIGLRDLVVYWAFGQAMLVLGGFVFQKITGYDVHQTIEDDDNAAAGLSFGGFLTALGVVMQASLTGAGSQLVSEISTTFVLALCGFVAVVLTRIATDKVLLPSSPLSKEVAVDKNLAAGAVAAASFISVAVVYASVVSI